MAQLVLMISDGDQLHKCHLKETVPREIIIGNHLSDTVTFLDIEDPFTVEWNGHSCQINNQSLEKNNQLTIETNNQKIYIYLIDMDENNWHYYDITTKYSVTFGATDYDEVQITKTKVDLVLTREKLAEAFKLVVQQGHVYHNFSRITKDVLLQPGDQLFFDGVLIIVGKQDIQICSSLSDLVSKLVPLLETDLYYNDEYPDYHRSPRIIYREPEDKRTIAKPSPKPSKPSEQLARMIVPPLVMIAALGLVSIFQPRGIYIVIMLSMTVVTIIFSITTYVKNVKKYKVDTKKRDKSYKAYLQRKTKELHDASEEQRHALHYHYPSIQKIRNMVIEVDARIYEKTMFHHDFLTYRAGLGKVDSSFELDFNEEEFSQEQDELVDAARDLSLRYDGITSVPIVANLMKGPVGYIGQRNLVLEQLQLLVMQLSLFHSYHDVQFITIFPEEEKETWYWMRWLPHASLKDVNVRGFVYHERSRDQVLHSLYQILKERQLVLDEQGNKNEKTYFTPHFTVLITDEKLILDHTIMEFFNEDPSKLGVSLIFVQDVLQSLPEHVKTVVDIRDAKDGNILLEEGELVNRYFTLDHFPKDFDKEEISRSLAPINHLQSLKSSIPETVTFLEMYGVEKVEELGIGQLWAKNETYKSMAVPLGLRGKDDHVYLNLHEKAHGPHGLVAGTTGSGKSEIIQSYIISLAVNFHPYEVAFLLIDYKGGGMANLFNNLPHLLGTITNLDGAQSMRALASIKAELQKRQRLFGEHDVNHINQYQKLFKQGEAKEAMPHLFLISDEFAELKSEQPDFMKELVSTARIGRSLGIHLILATQKPSGVVDDQIWSNSKFKLALKVQDSSDSNEILKTPDAAEITLPGRAYLQVGNNEIYELFQSAWSGADYLPDKEDQQAVDTTIYAINDLGQYDILTEDLSGLAQKEEVEKTITELDAVIDYIHDFTEQAQIEPLARPWLPPLQEIIYLPILHPLDYKEAWEEVKSPLEPIIGFADFPELQDQKSVKINLTKDGHILVLSSPGYGKSTFLQTVVMDTVRLHHPGRLHMYLLDFGTNGLLPLKDLPHVADLLLVDEDEKIGKLMRRLTNEIKERKQKLSKYGVANIEMYEKASKEDVPNIVLIIDNYDSVRETDFVDEFESLMTQIAREGGSMGIHLIISAGRQNALRTPLLSNIKTQIALYLIDHSEARTIVGRTDLGIEEIPGRGLIKLEQPTLFQTALPVEGNDTLAVIEGIQAVAKEMTDYWTGDLPEAIPMVPEVIHLADFMNKSETEIMINDGKIPFAVDFEEVKPMELSVIQDQNTLILGELTDTIEQTFITLISSISHNKQIDVGMIDNGSARFGMYKENVDLYAQDQLTMNEFVERLQTLYEAREDAFREIQASTDGQATLTDFLHEVRPMVVLITDVSFVIDQMESMTQATFAKLLQTGARMGIYFVVGAVHGAIDRLYDDITTALKKQKVGVLIGRITDQNMLDVMNRPYREQNLLPYEAYYIKHGQAEKIKIVAPH